MPAERRRRRHACNGRTHDSTGKKRGLAQCQGEASVRKLAARTAPVRPIQERERRPPERSHPYRRRQCEVCASCWCSLAGRPAGYATGAAS
jgi:hypothetical protein